MGFEAIESCAREVVGRQNGVPAAADQSFGPDIIRMEKIEDTDQKLGGQVVERVTCIGHQALDKALFASAERADQIGQAARRSAVCFMPDTLHILRCIALAQWEVEIGLHQDVSHRVGPRNAVGCVSCDCGDYVVELYFAVKGVVPACLTSSFAMTRRGGQASDNNRAQAEARSENRGSRVKSRSVGGWAMFRNVTPSQAAATNRQLGHFEVGVRRRRGRFGHYPAPWEGNTRVFPARRRGQFQACKAAMLSAGVAHQ